MNKFDGMLQFQRFCRHNRANGISSSFAEKIGSILAIMIFQAFRKEIFRSCKVMQCHMGNSASKVHTEVPYGV